MPIYSITFKAPEYTCTIDCPDDVYLLDALEQAGYEAPYLCREGVCTSCAGFVKSGAVDQTDQNHLNEDQILQGFVLLCVAYPLNDCIILTHKEEDLY